ncbi:NnrS family protein [Rhizobium alvei]|uniref:NnrS family protein n=1 Tax=Rhizobium alvei TaxID=1132659 RepID=A0ABT8YT29_9HYPH|nr:NnrS family protein [Rhizobium alvei]MDO6966889.1 NnrS family protein [Rhizobium alvei]
MSAPIAPSRRRPGGIPRGLSATGSVLFSYGFRPFFLAGALWAVLAMTFWISTLSGLLQIGGSYGAFAWHAHEMLFGFSAAIVAGFLLTAVPNWTGRLPVSGPPLMVLFLLWFAGRLVLVEPDAIGLLPSMIIDSLFLPVMQIVCVREIIAGRKWGDLKVVGGLGALALANILFHVQTVLFGNAADAERLALAALTMMIVIVGGRMIPSFTRNWLKKTGRTDFPVPYNQFDVLCILSTVPALGLFVLLPDSLTTAGFSMAAALLNLIRLLRWRGWNTAGEPLLLVLHIAYGFIPAGLIAIAASALTLSDANATLHVLTVGTIASMMLAVMTRATRGHTGRELSASPVTCLSYVAIFLCAVIRPAAGLLPEHAMMIYSAAAALWIGAFALYLIEYGPMLVLRRKPAARTG